MAYDIAIPMPATLEALPQGRAGVQATLKRMAGLVNGAKRRGDVREVARELVQGVDEKNKLGEMLTLFYFVRDQVRYVKDVRGVETLHTPEKILANMAGDCDDKSVLLAALLETIGIEARFIAVGFSENTFSHVFVQALVGGKWISLETTEKWNAGQQAPGIKNMMIQYI